METILKIKVDEFLAHKIEDIVKIGTFESEGDFLKSAVEDKVRMWEILKLNTRMDKFAEQITKKRPESVTEAVLKAREEEDEIL
jgi:Arc/MetJ-type ribon-helix-helix transcriptional regulator